MFNGVYVRLEDMYLYARLKYESSLFNPEMTFQPEKPQDKRNKLGQERPIKNDYI